MKKVNFDNVFFGLVVTSLVAFVLYFLGTCAWYYAGGDLALKAESRSALVEKIDLVEEIRSSKEEEALHWATCVAEMEELKKQGNRFAPQAVAEFRLFEKRAKAISEEAERCEGRLNRALWVYDLIH